MNYVFEEDENTNKKLTFSDSENDNNSLESDISDNLPAKNENMTKEIVNEDILEKPLEEDEEFIKQDILNLDLKLNKLTEKIDANDIFFEAEKKSLEDSSLEENIQNQDLKEVKNILTNAEEKLIIENSNISSESQLSSYIQKLETIENYVNTHKLNNFFKIDKKLFKEKNHEFFILKTQIHSYLKSNKVFIDKKVTKMINLRVNNLKSVFYNVKLTRYSFFFLIIVVFLLLVFVIFTFTAFFVTGWWK